MNPPVSPVVRPPRGLARVRARGARWRAARQRRRLARTAGARTRLRRRVADAHTAIMSTTAGVCAVVAAAITWGPGAAWATAGAVILALESLMGEDDQP